MFSREPIIDLGRIRLGPPKHGPHTYFNPAEPSAARLASIFDGYLYDNRSITGRAQESHAYLVKHYIHDIGTWHYDHTGMYPSPETRLPWIVIWSNRNPTEVRGPGGVLVTLLPHHLYLINNGRYSHRMPVLTREDVRKRVTWRAHLRQLPIRQSDVEIFQQRM